MSNETSPLVSLPPSLVAQLLTRGGVPARAEDVEVDPAPDALIRIGEMEPHTSPAPVPAGGEGAEQ